MNYQGTRQRSGLSPGTFISTTIPSIPTDRSEASISEAFFGNTTTPIDPVVLKLLNFKSNQFGNTPGGYLIPSVTNNLGNGFGTFAVSRPGTFDDDQFTTNWDKEFHGGNDKISARFFFSNSQTFEPFGAGGAVAGRGWGDRGVCGGFAPCPRRVGGLGGQLERPPRFPIEEHRGIGTHSAVANRVKPRQLAAESHDLLPGW